MNFRHFTVAGVLYATLFGLLLAFSYLQSVTNQQLKTLVAKQDSSTRALIEARQICELKRATANR